MKIKNQNDKGSAFMTVLIIYSREVGKVMIKYPNTTKSYHHYFTKNTALSLVSNQL